MWSSHPWSYGPNLTLVTKSHHPVAAAPLLVDETSPTKMPTRFFNNGQTCCAAKRIYVQAARWCSLNNGTPCLTNKNGDLLFCLVVEGLTRWQTKWVLLKRLVTLEMTGIFRKNCMMPLSIVCLINGVISLEFWLVSVSEDPRESLVLNIVHACWEVVDYLGFVELVISF